MREYELELRRVVEEVVFKKNIKVYDYNNKEVLRTKYTDKVLELYSIGVSLLKIQKQLTADAISKNLISSTIKRYNRKKGESNKIVEFPTLFSMNTIKKIIKENDIKLREIGRQKNEVKELTKEEQQHKLEFDKKLKVLQLQKYKINAKIKVLKDEYEK